MQSGLLSSRPVIKLRKREPFSQSMTYASMARHELDQGPMEVSYGYDGASAHYYLSVVDSRLQRQKGAPWDVNRVCEARCEEGSGRYLDLYTGSMGRGQHVTVGALAVFWTRYGVPRDHVQCMLNGEKTF